MEKLTLEKRQLCDIQGRLFELALKARLDCPLFIESFMNSKTAAALDDVAALLIVHTVIQTSPEREDIIPHGLHGIGKPGLPAGMLNGI